MAYPLKATRGTAAYLAVLILFLAVPSVHMAQPADTSDTPLAGTDWELKAYGTAGSDSLQVVMPDPSVSYGPFLLHFDEEPQGFIVVSGTDGCNDFYAFYEVDADSSLMLGELAQTLMDICYQRWPSGPRAPWFGAMRNAVSYSRPAADSLHIYWRYDYSKAGDDTLRVLVFEPYDESSAAVPEEHVPDGVRLHPNAPNPFTDATTLHYELPRPAHVTLAVYDVLGREVARLVDERRPAGDHAVRWAPRDLPGGVYVYRLRAGAFTAARRMVLVR